MITSRLLQKLSLKAESLLENPHNIVDVSIIDRNSDSFIYSTRIFSDDYESKVCEALTVFAALIRVKQGQPLNKELANRTEEIIEKRNLNIQAVDLYIEVKSSYGLTENQVDEVSLTQILTLDADCS